MAPWTAAHQASLSFTISQSLLKLMSIESMMSQEEGLYNKKSFRGVKWESALYIIKQCRKEEGVKHRLSPTAVIAGCDFVMMRQIACSTATPTNYRGCFTDISHSQLLSDLVHQFM